MKDRTQITYMKAMADLTKKIKENEKKIGDKELSDRKLRSLVNQIRHREIRVENAARVKVLAESQLKPAKPAFIRADVIARKKRLNRNAATVLESLTGVLYMDHVRDLLGSRSATEIVDYMLNSSLVDNEGTVTQIGHDWLAKYQVLGDPEDMKGLT